VSRTACDSFARCGGVHQRDGRGLPRAGRGQNSLSYIAIVRFLFGCAAYSTFDFSAQLRGRSSSTSRNARRHPRNFQRDEGRAQQLTALPEIMQLLRAFPRKACTIRTSPTNTLVRNHQQGPDHFDDGFVQERFARRRPQNYPHLGDFHQVLEAQ
jgi:hypothetical protein